MKILVIDVGGTNLKVYANGHNPPVKVPSGPHMTARKMVNAVLKIAAGTDYSGVSMGYPGSVKNAGRAGIRIISQLAGWDSTSTRHLASA